MKPFLALLVPALIGLCPADTIRLRNGTELEGIIVSEDNEHYVALVQVTKTIRDQRKIPKSDVIEIVGVKKDEVAFEAIQKLTPTPDLLGPEEYKRRIEDTEEFVTTHASSRLASDAIKILKELEEEAAVVKAGGIKFNGKIIPAEERAKKAYTLDSQIAASAVTTAGDAGNRTAALRAWSDFEKEFPTSRAFIETKPYVIKLMRSQLAAIDGQLATLDKRLKERADGIERIPSKDRARTKQILAEESAEYLRLIEQEKKAQIRWISLDPYHKAPMTQTKSLLEREIKRLTELDNSSLPDTDKAWEDAWTTLRAAPTAEEAKAAITETRTARLPQEYMDRLEAMLPE